MIPALLFSVIIVASAIVPVFYKSFVALSPHKSDLMFMLLAATAPPALVYAVICGFAGFEFTLTTTITALAGAALNIVTIGIFLKTMSSGSFTIAVIVINLNFVIPILLSVLFLQESASVWQLIGMCAMIAVIVAVNIRSKTDNPVGAESETNIASDKPNQKNLVFLGFAVLACVCNGVLNFVIKLQQYYTPGSGENTFYFVMYGSACMVCAAGYLATRLAAKDASIVRHEKKAFPLGLCVGACTVASQYPQSFLARYVSAAVEFTVIAAMAVLLSITIGFICYKEKPTVRNISSAVCCLLAIFLQLIT